MPFYEYACQSCGHHWEVEQGIKDPPKKVCPKCKKRKAKRQIAGRVGVTLLGEGWSRDGYR